MSAQRLTHCMSCDGTARPLKRGIAVHFSDQQGDVFVTGPDCYKKHTDISSLSYIPVVGGIGFNDISTGAIRASVDRLYSGATPLERTFDQRQDDAFNNVMLRAPILPQKGFRIDQPGLKKYLPCEFPYHEKILQEIEEYVQEGLKRGRRELWQLKSAQYVFTQITALKDKKLSAWECNFLAGTEKRLKIRQDLSSDQMKKLEELTTRHGLHLENLNIRFP